MDTKKFSLITIATLVGGAILFLLTLVNAPGEAVQGAVATSNAVQIPEALVLAFNALLFGLLTAGFTFILRTFGLNLLEFALPLAGTLATFLLGLVQSWIDLQPISSDPYIMMVLNILVVIIGGLPFFLLARRNNLL